MLNKIIHFLLIFLFLTIPLVNSHLLDFFWLSKFGQNFYVNWNYEFTKTIYFNIFSSVILVLYLINFILKKNYPYLSFRHLSLKSKGKNYWNIKQESLALWKSNLNFSAEIFFLILILFISSIFSIAPEISFFGNTDKNHSFLTFINLIWIYIILKNSSLYFIKKLLKYTIFSLFITIFFAIKEYFFPNFDYWDLQNRAFWFFGHPNYLSLYLLLFVPIIICYLFPLDLRERIQDRDNFLFQRIQNSDNPLFQNIFLSFLLILIIFTIILTKSILAIFLLFSYILYFFINYPFLSFRHLSLRLKGKKNNVYYYIILFWIIFSSFFILFFIIKKFWYSKFDSLISRFFIWETTLKIIFSDIKTFFIWNWAETLALVFDNFKSQFLYIFENFWFTADRPHNIFLNIFYHFWIFWLIVFIYLLFRFFKENNNYPFLSFKKLKSNNYPFLSYRHLSLKSKGKNNNVYYLNHYKESLVLALVFLCFNYASISSYLVIILFISFLELNYSKVALAPCNSLYKKNLNYKVLVIKETLKIFIIFYITFFSIVWAYLSYKLYKSEILFYKEKYIEAKNNYTFWDKLYNFKTCEEKIKSWNKSAENYFYCWDFYYDYDQKKAINYYKLWLEKLPDLWNKNSKFYNNFFIKNNPEITHRFFSEKYSNIKEILQRIWKN